MPYSVILSNLDHLRRPVKVAYGFIYVNDISTKFGP
jgi:hypothetical protein